MPYINILARDKFKRVRRALRDLSFEDPGELNYILTQVILKYLKEHGESYKVYNDIMGAQTGSQMEFYRRYIAPYEDLKIKKNGDL